MARANSRWPQAIGQALISHSVAILVSCYFYRLPCLLQRVYICTARQLRRIDSVRRSPLFSHYEESVAGAASIRAYNKVDEFISTCDRLTDDSQRVYYLVCVSQRYV